MPVSLLLVLDALRLECEMSKKLTGSQRSCFFWNVETKRLCHSHSHWGSEERKLRFCLFLSQHDT